MGHTNIQASVRGHTSEWTVAPGLERQLPGHIGKPASVLHVGSAHLQQNTSACGKMTSAPLCMWCNYTDLAVAEAESGGQGGTRPRLRSGTGHCTESRPPGLLPLVLGPFCDGVRVAGEGGPG